MTVNHRVPFVKIVEQPTARGYRFRYSSDRIYYLGGENRGTHPSVKVVGYNGPILVAVSCVTKDQPFRYFFVFLIACVRAVSGFFFVTGNILIELPGGRKVIILQAFMFTKNGHLVGKLIRLLIWSLNVQREKILQFRY